MQQIENLAKKKKEKYNNKAHQKLQKQNLGYEPHCMPFSSSLISCKVKKVSFGSYDWASCCRPIWPRIQKIGIIFTLSLTKGHMQVKPKRKPETKIRPKQLQGNGRSRNHQNPEGSKIQYHLARQKFQSINSASVNVMHLCFIWQG